jgi:hypothetical protein
MTHHQSNDGSLGTPLVGLVNGNDIRRVKSMTCSVYIHYFTLLEEYT